MWVVDFVALGMVAIGVAGLLAAGWFGVGRRSGVEVAAVALPERLGSLVAVIFASVVISGIYVGALTPRSATAVLWIWALVRLVLAWMDRRGSVA